MATGGSPTWKDNVSRFTCSLCLEHYSKRRCPKILPCFHTFCLPCLVLLEGSVVAMATPDTGPEDCQQTTEQRTENNGKEEEADMKPNSQAEGDDVTNTGDDAIAGRESKNVKKAEFPCPTCRAPVPIPEGGVTFLQNNFYLESDAASDKSLWPPKCNMCRQGSEQQASHVCGQCDLRMCTECRRQHDLCTRDHHVTPLIPGQPEQAAIRKKLFCVFHPDQVLHFYCKICDTGICLVCKLTSHEGHQTVDISSVEAECLSEIPALLTEAQQQLQLVQSSVRRVEREERDLNRHARNLTQQIRSRYDIITANVTQSRDKVLEEVAEMEERAKSQLRAQQSSASLTVDTLSALVTRAARAGGSDVISLRKELEAALLSEDMLEQHRQQDARQVPWSEWTYDVPRVSAVPLAACMGRVVEVGGCDVTKPLSLAELTDKLGRLEDDVKTITTNMKDVAGKTELGRLEDTVKTIITITEDVAGKTELDRLENDVKTITTNMKKKADKTELTYKLGRLEVDVKTITTNMKDVARKTELGRLENDVKTITTNMKEKADKTELIDELGRILVNVRTISTNMKGVAGKTELTANQLKADIKAINTEMKKQADKIAKAGRKVAFHAVGIDRVKTKKDQPIIFSEVKVNEGGGYDEATGQFTAPVRGTYVFSAGVAKYHAGKRGCVGAVIMVDCTGLVALYGSDTSTGSNCLSIPLDVGQTVWVQAVSDGQNYAGMYEMSFTGALVQPEL